VDGTPGDASHSKAGRTRYGPPPKHETAHGGGRFVLGKFIFPQRNDPDRKRAEEEYDRLWADSHA
jgi:hypothetical protein